MLINFQKKLYFQTFNLNNKTLISLFILLILSAAINFSARYYEKSFWEKNPSVFYAEDQPLIRTGDPAYYVNIAIYLKKNLSVGGYYEKLNFPQKINYLDDPPLISKIISYLAKDSSLKEIVKASNNFILFSSILTCFGVFFLFYSIGRPFEGIVASIGGGISTNYLLRSSIGYIDTDILNLFFMYFLFGVIYLSSKKQSLVKSIFLVIIAGLVGKLFYIWYPKPELILMSFFSLVFFTIFNSKDLKILLLNSCIYILLTGPFIYFNSLSIFINNPYLGDYLSANIKSSDLIDRTNLNFNNIFKYIGEQTKPPLIELFKLEHSIILGLICFFGIILWAITYPIFFIGLAPLSLFFLLSIVLGTRALFYSGPFMWFGIAYFTNFVSFKLITHRKLKVNSNYIYLLNTLILLLLSILLTNVFNRGISPTYISNSTNKAFINLNNIVQDKDNSVIVADWSYGYQSVLYNDIPILIHGGIPTSPKHYFISRAFTSHTLDETSKILNYVANGNVEKIKEKDIDTFQKLSKDIYNSNEIDKDIYLVLTQQQKNWIGFSAAAAYWDIEKSKPHMFNGKSAFEVFTMMKLNCDALDPKTYTTMCANHEDGKIKDKLVNLALGLFEGEPILSRVVQVTDGKIEINQEYENSKGNTVFQIIKNSKDNSRQLYLMHEAVFRSTYNKLFHLNESDDYELVYNDYPHVKVYKIN